MKSTLRLLGINAYNLHKALLIAANRPPILEQLYQTITNPQVGDLVMETSTVYYEENTENKIGRLLKIEDVPYETADEWKANGNSADEPIPTRPVYTLKLLNGDEMDWENCSFIKIPEDIFR